MSFAPLRLRSMFEEAMRNRQAGLQAEANALYSQILQAVPYSAEDFYWQGSILVQMGRFADAAQRFDSAVQMGPATVEMLVDRSVALAEIGRLKEAVDSCAQAMTLNPDFAHAYFIHGDCLREMGHLNEALESFDKALALNPEFLAVLTNRAALLTTMCLFESALADYDRLLNFRPGDPECLNGRGQVLGELARYDEALESLDRALAINPRHIKALSNRGVVLWNMQRFEEALASYDRALMLNPNLAATLSNKANTLQDLLRLDDALVVHDRVLALHPDFAAGYWNRSQCLLLMDRYKEGFAQFEWRKKRVEVADSYLAGPDWLGAEDLAGKTLLIRAEQGLGDTLHFVRYAALAQAKGAKVILAVQNSLIRLLEGLVPPAQEIVDKDAAPPPFDYHTAMMSLPLAFGTDTNNIPAATPYLKAEPALVKHWAAKLGDQGFKVGIAWRGAGNGGPNNARAFAVRHLEAIANIPGVRLISLQKGVMALEQLASLPPGMTVETLEDFDQGSDGFVDTAAVMENLDLVISSDTAIAHLAGALGRPTWLAVKFVPEWRWRLTGAGSPWYPTMRLFRQQTSGNWSSVFAEMAGALAKRLAN